MKYSKSLSAAIAATTSLLLAIPAGASVSSWSIPQPLSVAGQAAEDVQVVSIGGRATAVWERFDGSDYIIQSRTSLDGGTWSSTVDLSLPGASAEDPQIAVNSDGLIIAVWERNADSVITVQSRTSSDGLTWSPTFDVSASGESGWDPQIAVGSNGRFIVVWDSFGGDAKLESRETLDGVTWEDRDPISDPGISDVQDPQIAIGSNGLAAAVWRDASIDGSFIKVSTSLNGGAWSNPVSVSTGDLDPREPQVAVDSTGRVTVVWELDDDTLATSIVQSNTGTGVTWQGPLTLSTSVNSTGARDAQIVVDSNGRATAVWESDEGPKDLIQSRTSLNGGTWSPLVNVSALNEGAGDVQLTINSSGLVIAVWEGDVSDVITNDVIRSSTSLNGGTWSTPLALFAYGDKDADDPQVTVDSTGLVTAVWERDPTTVLGDDIIEAGYSRLGSTPPTPPNATTVPTATLAATGANVEWLMFAGVIALIGGASFLTVSRRKRTA